jgi:hypothetical protein
VALIVLCIGILLIASGIKGTEHELGARLTLDMSGSDGFIVWIGAIALLALVSRIPGFERPVQMFMLLILAMLFIGNPAFFTNLADGIAEASAAGPAASVPFPSSSSSSSSSGAGGSTGGSSSSGSSASTVSEIETGASVAALFV